MRQNEFIPHEPEGPLYTSEITDDTAAQKKKKPKPKAPKTESGTKEKINSTVSFFKSKRFVSSVGALLTLGSVFIFFASISYFVSWKNDQDALLNYGFWDYIFNNNIPSADNWLGKFGAWTGHVLIYNSFGIPAISLCFIFFLFGIKLLFNIQLFPLGKTTLVVLVYMVWGSIFLGFFESYLNFAGGVFGTFVNEWLKLTLGGVFTIVLDFVLLYIFTTLLFNPNYGSLLEKLKPSNLKGDYFGVNEEPAKPNNVYQSMDVINPIKENEIEEDIVSNPIHFTKENELELEMESDMEISFGSPEAPLPNELEIIVEPEAPKEEPIVKESSRNEDDMLAARLVKEYGLFDPTRDLDTYILPPIELLKDYGGSGISVSKVELEGNKDKIVETLSHYKIDIAKIKATVGPTVTLYEIVPAPGVRISKIKNLEDDIALSLSALGIRIIAPIPGKGTIGIEVPNLKPEMVSMRSLIASDKFQNFQGELPIVMGKTITNETFVFDMTKMPHLLVAGATGQGKSVGLNAILVSLLYKKHPAQVKFVLVDPKKVELTLYNKIERHFLAKLPGEADAIIVDTSKVVNTLNSLCIEMDDRYELLKIAGVRTIKEYNEKFIDRKLNPEKGHKYLPYIIVLIDEFADLIMTAGKEVEHPIARIAQLARAIGIHLIVATQRPSVNVITGMIKANFPARIAFRVLSKIDSRTILDASGADQLIGRGDMLISTGSDMLRLQCGFVDTPEVEDICEFVGEQRAYPSAFLLPEYVAEGSEGNGDFQMDDIDPLFIESARMVVINQQGSASLLQRKLKLGYNRAGRIVDQLEAMGIIGNFQGSKARDVLFTDLESLDEFLKLKGLL